MVEFEEVVPRRALGEGRWDKKLKERMVQLSVADNYDEAKREWIVTDNVWYIPYSEDARLQLPEVHCVGNELHSHPHECLCGHPIVWHFEIENTENGNMQIVGSEHIESYMVIRHFEKQGIDPSTITEEMIEEWLTEKVKSLKAEWWWKLHGEQFEEWFEAIKEIDLRINVRSVGQGEYNSTTQRFERRKVIRKRAEGKFGEPFYKMASIVWRWNHPDNEKRQIETRGYPNERLWNDLQMFAILIEKHKETIRVQEREIETRMAHLEKVRKEREEKQAERDAHYRQMRKERKQREEEHKIEQAELDGVREEKRLNLAIAGRIQAEQDTSALAEMCEYFDLPLFSTDMGETGWEKRFLTDMIYRLSQKKKISQKQLETLRNIVVDEPLPATDKQIWYIKKLADDDFVIPENLNKKEASALITKLKGEK